MRSKKEECDSVQMFKDKMKAVSKVISEDSNDFVIYKFPYSKEAKTVFMFLDHMFEFWIEDDFIYVICLKGSTCEKKRLELKRDAINTLSHDIRNLAN